MLPPGIFMPGMSAIAALREAAPAGGSACTGGLRAATAGAGIVIPGMASPGIGVVCAVAATADASATALAVTIIVDLIELLTSSIVICRYTARGYITILEWSETSR